ncbi:pollen-specific leucine-rich repeat extensin-like protein 2 [Daucus carota subsp. sativus]|uniref:pollen-specific leucine-rich repeat extensin-like protein 2 n=1 Tax=Daucus carota subsp. sativus TaxID=79200 RepID=UPI003083E079
MDLPPVQQPQPQQQQPQPPVSPTATRQPGSSTPKPKRATKSDAAPSTKKTRTSVATQVLKSNSDVPTNSDRVPPASPKSKTARFKRRANKPKRAKVPITEITDFTVEEEQAPSTSLTDISQALMVHPLQAVPISAAAASSTSSEVDEEIICKEQATAEAETTVSDS